MKTSIVEEMIGYLRYALAVLDLAMKRKIWVSTALWAMKGIALNSIVQRPWYATRPSANDLLQVGIFVSGIVGQVFVANLNLAGFAVWIVCNALCLYASWKQRQWGMSALYLFYTATCVYSMFRWAELAGRC
jgi:multidrug transporter EmrE-like cation transporter